MWPSAFYHSAVNTKISIEYAGGRVSGASNPHHGHSTLHDHVTSSSKQAFQAGSENVFVLQVRHSGQAGSELEFESNLCLQPPCHTTSQPGLFPKHSFKELGNMQKKLNMNEDFCILRFCLCLWLTSHVTSLGLGFVICKMMELGEMTSWSPFLILRSVVLGASEKGTCAKGKREWNRGENEMPNSA